MSEASDRRIDDRLTRIQVEVASGFAAINARLDASKDHEPRIRDLRRDVDRIIESQLTREDAVKMIAEALESARRPRWQDVGMLIVAIATSVGLVLTVARALGAAV